VPLWDITRVLGPATQVWPGDPPVDIERVKTTADSGFNVSRLCCSVHSGTHVDAPAHFYDTGDGADLLPLDILVGPCLVADLDPALTPPTSERILFRSHGDHLDEAGARRLLAAGVRLVGIDADTIEAGTDDFPVHRLLLGAGVVILEGLDMEGVRPGEYELICLPLRLQDADGAPARVVLKRG
jgi:arylformamidase